MVVVKAGEDLAAGGLDHDIARVPVDAGADRDDAGALERRSVRARPIGPGAPPGRSGRTTRQRGPPPDQAGPPNRIGPADRIGVGTPGQDTAGIRSPGARPPERRGSGSTMLHRVRSGQGGDEFGVAVGRPVLLVELDQRVPAGALQPPVGWPCVLVATSTAPYAPVAPSGPDVLISAAAAPPRPWVGADGRASEATWAVEEAVLRNPQAATALAQVIRLGPTLEPAAALVVESLAYSTLQSGPEHGEWLATRPNRGADARTDPVVQLDRQGDDLWVTLDRPERRNAYSARMRDELVAALELAANDPSVASIHLRGNGPNFSSGGDLAEFGTRPDPASAHGIRVQRSAGWWISQLRPKVTAHLHGTCVGAGIELSAFAGTVEAAEGTTVSLPEVSMGLIPGAGGTASIPRRIRRRSRAAWPGAHRHCSGRRTPAGAVVAGRPPSRCAPERIGVVGGHACLSRPDPTEAIAALPSGSPTCWNEGGPKPTRRGRSAAPPDRWPRSSPSEPGRPRGRRAGSTEDTWRPATSTARVIDAALAGERPRLLATTRAGSAGRRGSGSPAPAPGPPGRLPQSFRLVRWG